MHEDGDKLSGAELRKQRRSSGLLRRAGAFPRDDSSRGTRPVLGFVIPQFDPIRAGQLHPLDVDTFSKVSITEREPREYNGQAPRNPVQMHFGCDNLFERGMRRG